MVVVFAAACSVEVATSSQEIVRGTESAAGAHPAVVFLWLGNGSCSGTLISPHVVLTARHCVEGVEIGALEVFFGNDAEGAGTWISATGYEYHSTGDIAVITMAEVGPAATVPVSARALTGADLPPALLAYGARVRVASTRGERLIPVHEFFKSYKIIDLAPDELIAEALLPAPPANARCAFAKIGTRRAQSIAKISLGAYCEVEGDRLRNVRLAAGSMGPIHLRLFQAEAAATAGACSRDLIEEAAMKTESDVTPIDDVRSTADYRRVVLGNLVRRFLSEAAGTA